MSKKIKTINELRAEIQALQETFAQRKAEEAQRIGEYVQSVCLVDTIADFQKRFIITPKPKEANNVAADNA